MLKLLLVNVSFNLLQLVLASLVALAIMWAAFYAFGIVFGLLVLVAVLLVDRVYVWTRRLRDFFTTLWIFRNLVKGEKS
jgi:sterol desaturase/sphingolipid hydroxylase (fatty acid hydroxylase superfamily)